MDAKAYREKTLSLEILERKVQAHLERIRRCRGTMLALNPSLGTAVKGTDGNPLTPEEAAGALRECVAEADDIFGLNDIQIVPPDRGGPAEGG